ncbi:MAG: PhzF family phenazine biosynthesis protein [Halioglobus sp.]|nr:PhzF family phenazine biosynthesis protein [Halioglobus sp.]
MSMPVAQGNPCRVLIMKAEPETAPQPSDITQCCTWLSDDGVPQVRCWAPGGAPVRLCGHGLLGCGTIWEKLGQAISRITMNDTTVQFYSQRNISWIGFEAIDYKPSTVPEWVELAFESKPKSAAVAGDEAGYLILMWPDNAELRDLPVPGPELEEHTRRAIIATCADAENPALDIRQRYFAPQHGTAEDAATGSAMRVLARFWQAQAGFDELRAWQCSTEGGHLFSRIEDDVTWIGGRVETDDA